MKIKTECVPCLLKRIIFEAEQSTTDKKKQKEAICIACNILSQEYDPDGCSATIATKVHKAVYKALSDNDPYKDLKEKSNKIALTLVEKVNELIKESSDPLKTSMLCSIVGNILDFGIEGASENPELFFEIFDKIYLQGLGYDDTDKIKNILVKSKTIILFTDNCGEIVFDKILCRELKKFNPKLNITLVVKGEPVLSDATAEDAHDLSFLDVVDEILTTNCFAVGVDFYKLSKKLSDKLNKTDLIICKGMANYESFSETDYHPIVYLLRTKCNAIASSMGLKQDINAIKLYD